MVTLANDRAFEQKGLHVSEAGLAFQVVSLIFFISLCALFARRVSKKRDQLSDRFASMRTSKRFRMFLWSKIPSIADDHVLTLILL